MSIFRVVDITKLTAFMCLFCMNYQTIASKLQMRLHISIVEAISDKNQWHMISIDATGMKICSRLEFTSFLDKIFSPSNQTTFQYSISCITEFWKTVLR